MNKDERLQKSHKNLKDEGEDYTENKGRKIVPYFFYSMCTFIIIFSYFLGGESTTTFYAANALLWGVMSIDAFVKFKFSHKKANLVTSILEAITSIASIVTFIILSLK